MFKISNNDFKLLNKCKLLMINIDNLLENVPRKNFYYKDRLKSVCDDLLLYIFECSYETNKENISYYFKKIKSLIASIDYMLDRLYSKKYINEVNIYRIGNELVVVNKIATGWLNSL